VYKYRLPAFWFFSSAQDGQVRAWRGRARAHAHALCALVAPHQPSLVRRGALTFARRATPRYCGAQIMKKKQINVIGPRIIESFTKRKARTLRAHTRPRSSACAPNGSLTARVPSLSAPQSCAAPDAPCAVHIHVDSAERHARMRGARSGGVDPLLNTVAASSSVAGVDGQTADEPSVTVVDFLDAEKLVHFMHHAEKQQDGAFARRVGRRSSVPRCTHSLAFHAPH
jgi:hypothetical protein